MTKPCELYPRIPAGILTGQDTAAALRHCPASAILITGIDTGKLPLQPLRGAVAAARSQNVAVLIENDARLAKELDASGVHLRAMGASLKEVRTLLGSEALIGVSCGLSRHDAMLAAEEGADYVAFGEQEAAGISEIAAMIQWWNELIEIPSVAWAQDGDDERTLRSLVEAGADYLSLPASWWTSPDAGEKHARLASICARERFSA